MPAPYYVGDEIPLEFTAKDGNGSGPASATVIVYDQDNVEVVASTPAAVAGGGTTVTYDIAESIIDAAGVYRAVFTVIFTGTITRRHVITFRVRDSSLRYNVYGTISGIEALIGDIVNSRTFTDTTVPSYTEVQKLIDGVASEINVELLQ